MFLFVCSLFFGHCSWMGVWLVCWELFKRWVWKGFDDWPSAHPLSLRVWLCRRRFTYNFFLVFFGFLLEYFLDFSWWERVWWLGSGGAAASPSVALIRPFTPPQLAPPRNPSHLQWWSNPTLVLKSYCLLLLWQNDGGWFVLYMMMKKGSCRRAIW